MEILPNRGRLSAFTVIPTLVKGEDVSHPSGEPIGDLVDMRRYVSGDSPRRILWKVYAHSRKLMVRIPERAIATSPRTSGFLFTSEKDEPSAGLARLAIEADILGKDWIFAVDGSFEYAEDRENAINLIVQSGNLEINNDLAYFQSFLKVSRSKGNYNLILFVPSSPGEWEEKLKLLKPDPFFDVAIAMAVDGSAQNLEGFTLKKYILKTEEIYRQSRKERVELLKRLNQFTRRITVIDRLTGRVLGNR